MSSPNYKFSNNGSEAVIILEERCPVSLRQVRLITKKYFSWNENYQNPNSGSFKAMESLELSHLILMNMGKRRNFTFRVKENTESLLRLGLASGTDLKSQVTFDFDNSQHVKFSTPYSSDYVTFGIKPPATMVNTVDGFTQSFSPQVWIVMFIAIFLYSSVLFSLSYSFREGQFKSSMFDSCSFVLKYLINGAYEVKSLYLNGNVQVMRFFITIWLLMSFIISNMYQSFLVVNLLVVKFQSTPETLEDLVDFKMQIIIPRLEYENIIGFLEDSGSIILKQLVSNVETVKDKRQCLDGVNTEDNKACVAYKSGLEHAVNMFYTNPDGKKSIQISKKSQSVVWIGFMMSKDFSNLQGDSLSSFILQLMAAGLLKKWEENAERKSIRVGQATTNFNKCKDSGDLFLEWFIEQQENNQNMEFEDEIQLQPACYYMNWSSLIERVQNCTKLEEFSLVDNNNGNVNRLDASSLIQLRNLSGIFMALIFGNALGLVSFIWEVKYNVVKKRVGLICKRLQGITVVHEIS